SAALAAGGATATFNQGMAADDITFSNGDRVMIAAWNLVPTYGDVWIKLTKSSGGAWSVAASAAITGTSSTATLTEISMGAHYAYGRVLGGSAPATVELLDWTTMTQTQVTPAGIAG